MMAIIRYIIGFFLVAAACWFNDEIRNWDQLRTFAVSPAATYAIDLVAMSILILGAGYCYGPAFKRQGLSRKAVVGVFLALLLLQVGSLLAGRFVASDWLARFFAVMVNMNLATYLSAFLAGICLGSKRL